MYNIFISNIYKVYMCKRLDVYDWFTLLSVKSCNAEHFVSSETIFVISGMEDHLFIILLWREVSLYSDTTNYFGLYW